MSKPRSNQNVNSENRHSLLKKKTKRQQAIERVMESLESRMLLSVSGFQPALNYGAGVGPSAVAKGDFNSDGKMDLVVANQTGNNVSVLTGNGDGSFSTPINYAAGNGPRAVVTGDFNGDGKLDIAVADAAGNNISVLINNGAGFNAPVSYNVGTDPLAIVAGDFTGHGKTDLAVANYQDNTITVLAANGDGTFGAAQTFSVSPAVNVGTGPNAIVSGDFNGDHKLDLAVSDAGGGVSILLSNGVGGFGAAHVFAAGTTPTGLVAGNFNGDTNLDLAVVNATGGNISVLLGAGDGSFASPTNYGAATGPLAITAGDFNNDSKTDLAVVNTDSNSVSILSGRGDGTFGTATNKSVGNNPQAIVAGDFNGDGSSDLAVANQTDDNVSILLDKHITVTGFAQNSHEGEALTGVTVATFVDSEAGTVVGDYTASINWGDGTAATVGTITFGGGHYSIAGSHTYADEGVFTITSTVQDTLGTTSQSTAQGKVRDAALASAGVVIAVNEGANFNSTVVTFTDANTAAPIADFTAVIDWGDGSSSNGTVVSDGGGAFHVNAAHVWHHKSTPAVTVVIRDVGSSKSTSTYTATIADAPLTPSAGTPLFTEGTSAARTIATFVDANPYGSAAEFSAQIHWGDGSADTAATISANGSGGYDVVGTHNYIHSGNKAASVSIVSVDGQTASQNVTVAVQNAAMAATATGLQVYEGIPFSNAPAGHFTDANPGATVGDFTATIDWGDGTALDHGTNITVDAGNPGFFVSGNHTYLHGSHPNVTVTVHGNGGTTVTASATAQVLNQVLSAFGPFQPVVNRTTPGELYRGVSGAFNTNSNPNLGIISASGAGGVTYMAGNGDGTFQTAVNYSIGHGPMSVAAGRFDAGGTLDLVTANTGGGISIALGNGDGTFAAATDLALSGDVHDVVVGDFNHDGRLDIATANYAAGTVSVLMGAGNGTFASAVNYNVGNNPYALTVADLNGDGKVDLAVANHGDGTISVLLNNGDGTFATAVTYAVGVNPVAIKTGNLAGDGKIGLVVSNNGDNTVSVLKGNGDGTFVSAVTYATGLGTQDLALVDLYGTGKPDILTADEGDGTVSILLNKGDGTYAPQMKMPANHGTLGLVTGDFNSDGKTDLVANSFNVNRASVFISNAAPVAAVEGTAFSSTTVLMHFADANTSAVAADFPTVSINWGDGQIGTGTVVASEGGGFDVIGGHSYDHAGKKTIVTTVTGSGEGVVTGATKVNIANAALSLTANTIAPTEGSTFSGKVAHFTDANAAASAIDFTAGIVWGDGSTTTGTVVAANGGGFDVNGVHTYAEEGTPTVSVTITGLGGGTASGNATATVADAALHSTGATITGVEGSALTGVTVASFTDDDPAGTSTDYTAVIHWGDTTTSAGTVAANGHGGFNVTGTHTYLHAGDKPVSVVITDAGTATTTAGPTTATINNAAVNATAGSYTSVEVQSHSQVIATFTDVNTSAIAGDFTATIDWGDGSAADHTGVIAVTETPGTFSLTGTHTYAVNGAKPISVTIGGAYDTVATTTLTAAVAINPTIVANAIAPTEGSSFSGIVAHFTDASSIATTTDFVATIVWGDGVTSFGTITSDSAGGFNVAGIHTYAEEGTQNFTVAIINSHATGGTAANGNTATVADAALHSAGVDITATEGTALTSVVVAAFSDDDPAGTIVDYSATIQWGDSTTSAGTIISDGNGGFLVTGTHTYLHAGDKAVSAVITDVGTATTTSGHSRTLVNNATITPTAGSFTSTEGVSTNGTVATFTDPNTAASTGDFSAAILWGDGTFDVVTPTATATPGLFNVNGTHLYKHAGTQPIRVNINGAYGQVATTTLTATINNATITPVSGTFVATEGSGFTGAVGHFSDPNVDAGAADFSASINWGDGTTTATVPGDIVSDGSGGFLVNGTHTYAEEGPATVITTITGLGNGTATSVYFGTLADAALTVNGANIVGIEGTGFTGGVVAGFTDADPSGTLSDFTATINWGDETSSAGTVTADGHGGWTVAGDHQYAVAATYTVTTTVNDAGGATQTGIASATIAHGTIVPTGVNVTAIEGTALASTTRVAQFSDTNLSAVAGDFTATIDWGDGTTPSTGSVTANGNHFDVTASHTYNHAGSRLFTITIAGAGDSKVTSATATINNNTIAITGLVNTAVEGTAFIGNVASFTDANTAAVKGDFTATIDWNDGSAPTTSTVNDKNGGGFFITGTHTYTAPGSYAPVVTITGGAGQTFSGSAVLAVADATLNPSAVTIHATEGTAFSGILASFQDQNHGSVLGDFTSTINWGDGQTDAGTMVALGGGLFNITGSHTWTSAGSRAVIVTIHDGGGASATVTSTSIVADATLTATGVAVAAVEGTPKTNALVATFGDANPLAVAAEFTATLTWGDGSATSTGTVTKNTVTGRFEVTGSHTYSHAGTKAISVVITDVGGAIASAGSTATIANDTLTITAGTMNGVEGQTIVSTIAHFSDVNASAGATDFSATINWGDSTTSVGAISDGAGGGFDVLGGHVYNHAGPHTVTVTVNGNGGGSVNTTVTAHVTNAALAGTGKTATVVENHLLNGALLANFTDANTHASAIDFTATIDWKDGSAIDGETTVTANVNGGFDVAGTHTYLRSGNKAPVVTLHGIGSGSATATGTVHVTNDTLTATGIVNLTVTEGVPFSNAPVAHFTDANPNATASDFTATIDWGDFLAIDSNTHIVANVNGGFDVLGDRTYAHAGNRPVTTTITGNGGGRAVGVGTAHVLNAALTSTGKTLNATEGVALGNVVIAHFTDANTLAGVGDFTALVDWGDDSGGGTGTVVVNATGGFDVMANHTFNHAGDVTYAVTIRGNSNGITTPVGTVHIANAVLTPSATAFTVTEGSAFTGQVVGHFTDANTHASAGDFNATIFWGDSSPADTTATIVANVNGGFDVVGGHNYAHAGDKTLGIQITGAGGTTVSTPNTAHVLNGVLTPTGYPVTSIEGAVYTGIVAHFTDANAAALAGEFAAAINWGDGTTGAGTLAANANGGFDVTGSHTYNPQGTRTITTTLTGQGNGQAVAISTMVVLDAGLTATGNTITGVANVGLNNVVVAGFVDANPLDNAGHFSATITWETGITSTGTIVQTSAGHYNVTGSHTYTGIGSQTVGVFIQDAGGNIATVNATVNVSGPGLNASFTPFVASEGTAFSGKLTHFSTTLGGAVAGNFAASIDWADGTTTAGTVTASAGGGFDVSGGHTWRIGGYKPVSVRMTNTGSGGYIIAGGNNYVGIKPLAATGALLKATAKVSFAAAVANFTSANALAMVGDFTATILWGDGTSSTGTVVAKSGGGFSVLATHIYATSTTFTAKVTINSISGATVVATTKVAVAKGVASKGPKVGGGHGGPPPTTHGGHPTVKTTNFGAWEKPQQLGHGI